MTGPSGGELARQGFYPYGGERYEPTADPNAYTAYDFTGQRLDGTGLHFYNARYYSGAIGRFVSADTLVPEPGNPQSLNRYAYVHNNPLRYTDPTGHCPVCVVVGIGIALVVWLANPEPVYAPEPGWTPPANVDPNYGNKAYFDAAPGTGDISDVYALITGRTLFTGEEVSRVTTGVFAALPLFSTGGFRQGRRFIQGLDFVVPGASTAVRRIGGPLSEPLKNALRGEARDIYDVAHPGLRTSLQHLRIQVHHRVPLEWAHLFPDADPNRLANLIGLPEDVHILMNNRWSAFRMSLNRRMPTAQEVLDFAAQIDREFSQYYR